jgi:hypothetical protein
MDGSLFDRITKKLADSAPRRAAIRAGAGATLATVLASIGSVADARKKRKKRCRHVGQTCGSSSKKGRRKCCNESGLIRCEQFPTETCTTLSGFYCCGQVGSICDPNFGTPLKMSPSVHGNCSCCDPLYCGLQEDDQFRCQSERT